MRLIVALSAVTLLAGTADASVITVYRETFPNQSVPDGTSQAQRVEMNNQGWFGRQHGVEPFTPPVNVGTLFPSASGQISRPGPGSPTALTAVNSNPVGPTNTTGALFWSPGNRAGIYLYTSEFQGLQSQDLRTVSFESNNNAIADPSTAGRMRLALQLNGTDWYISDQGVFQNTPGQWEAKSYDLAALTFGLFNDHNGVETATSLPRNNDGSSGLALPGGAVTAFGLYVGLNNSVGPNPTIVIDNFSIQAVVQPIPEPATLAVFGGLALAGLVARRRKA